jgi:hypothetical protein
MLAVINILLSYENGEKYLISQQIYSFSVSHNLLINNTALICSKVLNCSHCIKCGEILQLVIRRKEMYGQPYSHNKNTVYTATDWNKFHASTEGSQKFSKNPAGTSKL